MCSTGCKTQDHASWGECVRAKNFELQDLREHYRATTVDKQLAEYRLCKKEGMQPDGVNKSATDKAKAITKATGVPYRGDE